LIHHLFIVRWLRQHGNEQPKNKQKTAFQLVNSGEKTVS